VQKNELYLGYLNKLGDRRARFKEEARLKGEARRSFLADVQQKLAKAV
jgi:hypothetical protein